MHDDLSAREHIAFQPTCFAPIAALAMDDPRQVRLGGRALVTGGAGFIGSHLVRALVELGLEVTVVDDLSAGSVHRLADLRNVSMKVGSVADRVFMSKIFASETFEYVFHLAAIVSVVASVEEPLASNEVNFQGTLNLLEEIRRSEARPVFVFSSSAAVYGNAEHIPVEESAPARPMSPYAIDKYASERYALAYASLYACRTTALRYFNVYGPGQRADSPYSGVLALIANALHAQSRPDASPFTIFGDGGQTRDFVYVSDVVRANLFAAQHPGALGKVFNVGSGSAITLNRVIAEAESIVGRTLRKEYAPPRPGDIRRSEADIRALRGLGFEPQIPIDMGLRRIIEAASPS